MSNQDSAGQWEAPSMAEIDGDVVLHFYESYLLKTPPFQEAESSRSRGRLELTVAVEQYSTMGGKLQA